MMRPRQWIKNAFVMAPLFFTPPAFSVRHIESVVAGIVSFCALASAIYILNDYIDREADRKHPEKQFRPLAAGTLSTRFALTLMGILLASGSPLLCRHRLNSLDRGRVCRAQSCLFVWPQGCRHP
jgi:4-hydroxybenzoate polyprenyltransferase